MAKRKRNTGFDLVAACVVYSAACSAAFGQELGSLEWFKKEWKAASKWNVPAFTLFELDRTGHRYATAGEVRALAALVAGKPEHPKRREYEQKLAALENPNPKARTRIWFGRDGYRRSADGELSGQIRFRADEVTRKRLAWTLHEDTLSISDPRVAPPGQDYDSRLASVGSDARRFVLGGMGGSAIIKHRIISSQVDAQGKWHGVSESIDGTLVIDWSGFLDSEHEAILVESSTVRKAVGREYLLNTHWEYSNWAYSDYFGRLIAHKAIRFGSDDRPFITLELAEFSKFDPSEFKVLTRIPSDDVPDVIRGDISGMTVYDARPAVQEMRIVSPDGNVEVRSLAPAGQNGGSRRRRVIGVLVASMAIGGVWIVYRRRQ